MIERDELDGRPCTIAYLTRDWHPATRADHDLIRVMFDDGDSLIAVPEEGGAADAGWKEELHPRGGHPENKGQFSKSSGGASHATPSKEAPEEEEHHYGRPVEPAAEQPSLIRTDLEAVPEPYARKDYRAGGSLRVRPDAIPVRSEYKPGEELSTALRRIGADAPAYHEFGPGQGQAFAKLIAASKEGNPYGAAVHVYDPGEYNDMRLFATPDGKAGFALHGDDIISLFKSKGGPKNAVASALALAVKQGGRRLDAFDTVLPHLYSNAGFKAVARLPFDDAYAPEGWDRETFKDFNNGRPAVVGMVYDPNHEEAYQPGEGEPIDDYDQIADKQREALLNTGLAGSKGHSALISTRKPTGVQATEGDYYRRADLEGLQEDPTQFKNNMELLRDENGYPNFRPEEVQGKSPQEIAKAAIAHAVSNLKFLYQNAPKELTGAAHQWYEGANDLAQAEAKKYGIPLQSAVGVIAALSPQKDWDQNVYLARRLMEIHRNEQNTAWDQSMTDKAFGAPGVKAIWKPRYRAALKGLMGKRLGELTDPADKAMWIRTFDEAHGDRHYDALSPTGQSLGTSLTAQVDREGNFVPAKAGWQSIPSIASAVMALESGGDRNVLGDAMGDMHKVRSFYNNILDPHSQNDDVTMDTHAVGAALLRPLSGATTPVMHSLGTSPENEEKKPEGWKAASKSAVTGSKGTYGLWANAYRQAAKELGVEPRVLQSAVWEAKRRLMEDISKKASEGIDTAWRDYHAGKQDLPSTQKAVLQIAEQDQAQRRNRLALAAEKARALATKRRAASQQDMKMAADAYAQ